MEAAEHVVRYLHATSNKTIIYTRGSRYVNEMRGWIDADWAGDTDTRRSHTDYILKMNSGPICSKRSRQVNVSLSTSETNFIAASQKIQQVVYTLHTAQFRIPAI